MSRCPTDNGFSGCSGYELEAEQHINSIIAHSVPKSVTLSDILKASTLDDEIQNIIKCLEGDHWNLYPTLAPYKKHVDELTHKSGLLLRGSQIVIPNKLRRTVLEIAHNHI